MISKKGKNLIFIIGPPRSGTTLLSLILSKIPKVYCPPELWLSLSLIRLLCSYRGQQTDNSDQTLAKLAFDETFSKQRIFEFFGKLMVTAYNMILAKSADATVLIDKTPRYYKIIDFLSEIFPNAKFILISRNPLDIAASHKSRWNMDLVDLTRLEGINDASFDIYCALEIIANARDKLGSRAHWIRYEDLVDEPSYIIRGVCDFLGLSYTDEYLDYAKNNSALLEHKKSLLGDKEIFNRQKIDNHSVGRWRKILNNKEVSLVSSIVGSEVFQRLRYELVTPEADDTDKRNILHEKMIESLYSDYWSRDLLLEIQILKERVTSLNTHLLETNKTLDKEHHLRGQFERDVQRFRDFFIKMKDRYYRKRCRNRELENEVKELRDVRSRIDYIWPWFEGSTYSENVVTSKISIITPSFNQANWIEATIQSVLDQQYPNFEHIVVDGGSTDKTLEIVSRYPHIRFIQELDLGQTHAINKGILHSTGDIIAYLNSDDIYRPGAFRAVADALVDPSKAMIAVGGCDYIDEEGKAIGHLKPKLDSYWDLLKYWGWERWYCLPQQSTFWRREVLSETGLFDIRYHYCMDYEMLLRMYVRFPFILLDKTLSGFRMHAESKTISKTYLMYLEHRAAARRYWPSWWKPTRWYLEILSLRDTGIKLMIVAEHEALTNHSRKHPIHLLTLGFKHWPFILFLPRTILTLMTVITTRSRVAGTFSKLHRAFLNFTWILKQRFKENNKS